MKKKLHLLTTAFATGILLLGCAADQHHRAGLDAMKAGDYPKAISELSTAVKLDAKDVRYKQDLYINREVAILALEKKADIFAQQEKYPEAISELKTILDIDPQNRKAIDALTRVNHLSENNKILNEAKSAYERGEFQKADRLLGKILSEDPDNVVAKQIKRQIEKRKFNEFSSETTIRSLTKKTVNFDFKDVGIKFIFDAISKASSLNFVFDRDVRQDLRASLTLKGASVEEAVDVLLATSQLEKKIINANTILIYPNNAQKNRENQNLVIKAYYLNNADVKQTVSLLKGMLKIRDVYADERINMVLIRDTPDVQALAEKIVKLHDLNQPEVMLEVEILEINRSRLTDLGIKFTDKLTIAPTQAGAMKLSDLISLNSKSLGITPPSASLSFNADNRDANLLANPRIRVKDREKAKFMIGDKLPIVTTTNTPNGFSSENIQYLDVGLKLDVEPEVRANDDITLKMTLEVSSLVSSVKTNNGSLAYQIGTRSANSVLRLKDGETQILAGLISDEDRASSNGLPYVNEIPILGRLFSAKQDNKVKTEIVLSITPHIVRPLRRLDYEEEVFWSGTETNFKQKMPSSTEPKPGSENSQKGNQDASKASANISGITLTLGKQSTYKQQDLVDVTLEIRSRESLRSAPSQVTWNPKEFTFDSITEGNYFKKNGKSSFSYQVDTENGRISVGQTSLESGGSNGEGQMYSIKLKPIKPIDDAEIALTSFAPIGHNRAINFTFEPLTKKIRITE